MANNLRLSSETRGAVPEIRPRRGHVRYASGQINGVTNAETFGKQDHDVLMLFHARFDDIEHPDVQTNQVLSIRDLRRAA